jgi:hypothetical protein
LQAPEKLKQAIPKRFAKSKTIGRIKKWIENLTNPKPFNQTKRGLYITVGND